MNKTQLLLIYVCVALAAGALLTRPHVSGVDLTGKEEVTIRLTKNGFEPKNVYITLGTEVVFENDTDVAFWPASDTHPRHTLYPAFDAKQPVSAGGTWSFVFDKKGSWSFHDHLHASQKGTIVVLAPGETAATHRPAASCGAYEGSELLSCWSEHVTTALNSNGVVAAMQQIQKENELDPRFAALCHQFAHQTGLAAYAADGVHIPIVRELGYCDYGFFHGYMEGFIADHSDPADARAFCDAVGKALDDIDPLAIMQCNHGIGHGTMEYYLHTASDRWNDLPGIARDVTAVCEKTNEDDEQRFRCASGAYSVLFDWILQGTENKLFSLQAPFALCSLETSGWAERGCAWEASKRIRFFISQQAIPLSAFPEAFSLVERKADDFKNGAYADDILQSFSNLLGEGNVHSSNEDIVHVCRAGLATGAHQRDCISGAVQGLLYNAEPEREVDRAVKFCLSGSLNDTERMACSDAVVAFVAQSYQQLRLPEVCTALSGVVQQLPRGC